MYSRTTGIPENSSETTTDDEELIRRLVNKTYARAPAGGIVSTTGVISVALMCPDGTAKTVLAGNVPTDLTPKVTRSTPRANLFSVLDPDSPDVLDVLKAHDDEASRSTGAHTKQSEFRRDSSRLADAMNKRAALKRPTFSVAPVQPVRPFSFGGGPPPPERELHPAALAAVNNPAAKACPEYRGNCMEAIHLADYTTHDPDTLHPRFLEYVHERTTRFSDSLVAASFSLASQTMQEIWERSGVSVNARPMSDVNEETLRGIMNNGSPGEYRALGASKRLDDRMLPTLVASLERYSTAALVVSAGGPGPQWAEYTDQPVLTFGKKEPKSAKRSEDGSIVPPVPRLIFNMSPVNYAMAAFLHHDMSKSLQDLDPTHGPGFGPGRGGHLKFSSIIGAEFGDGTESESLLIMSDIAKWDANMPEILLEVAFDTVEGFVEKGGLSPRDYSARKIMLGVAKRQLLEKLVEHPSGYFLKLHGCMPSGSYYTSLLNTVGNDILALSYCAMTVYRATGSFPTVDRLATAAIGRLVSYGDNQLISSRMFSDLGGIYDVRAHAAHLSEVGMKLKIDETETTHQLGRVRFCSRAMVMTPKGPLMTRTHTSILAKLSARPGTDELLNKLYVRALMADTMGTDPILFDILDQVDRSIHVDLSYVTVSEKVKDVLDSFVISAYGDRDDSSFANAVSLLSTRQIERRALLSLHTPKGEAPSKLGSSLVVPKFAFTGKLTPAAEWCLGLNGDQFAAYVKSTGQTGVFYD